MRSNLTPRKVNRRTWLTQLALGATASVLFRPSHAESWPRETAVSPHANFLGVDTFFKVENLPVLWQGVQTRQFCSYDRAGDNYDNEYFALYTEPNGEAVIFDAMGPGCLHRHHMNIWKSLRTYNAAVATEGVNIRYYFDNEERPRINMDVSTFFSTNNPLGIFRYPLAVDGGDDFRLLYYPMFFQKRLKVALSREPGGPGSGQMPWTGRHDKLPQRRFHWYIYTFHTFTEDPGIPSWTPHQPQLEESGSLADWGRGRLGQIPGAVAASDEIKVAVTVPAGKRKKVAETSGAGWISSLRLRLEPVNEATLFETWLKISADGRSPAQVEAPLGAFFGANRKAPGTSLSSLLVGYAPSLMYCYFPMPYWKSVRIELDNRGRQGVSLTGDIQYQPSSRYAKEDCGHFFAHYHQEFPRTEGIDYTYLQWSGAGHVVGDIVSRFDTSMEEDERTYFDGSGTPQIHGDGFEDDHNMGWGLKDLQHAIFGATNAHGGSGTAYRFYIPDLYFFQSSVKHGHQAYGPHSPLGHEGMYQVGDEESVAFFYGRETPSLILTDELDIGNHDSEVGHDYQVTGPRNDQHGRFWYDGEFNNVLFQTPPIDDSGVAFSGCSQFRVRIDAGNRGVRIRRRTDKANNRQMANVYVDGRRVTERPWYTVDYEETYRDIRWFDTDFEIPSPYTEGKSSITLKIEYVSGKNHAWDEYHYWIFSYK